MYSEHGRLARKPASDEADPADEVRRALKFLAGLSTSSVAKLAIDVVPNEIARRRVGEPGEPASDEAGADSLIPA